MRQLLKNTGLTRASAATVPAVTRAPLEAATWAQLGISAPQLQAPACQCPARAMVCLAAQGLPGLPAQEEPALSQPAGQHSGLPTSETMLVHSYGMHLLRRSARAPSQRYVTEERAKVPPGQAGTAAPSTAAAGASGSSCAPGGSGAAAQTRSRSPRSAPPGQQLRCHSYAPALEGMLRG